MKHAREDYNRIQDPDGLIPEDEPVFLLRAKDALAPEIVYAWAVRLEAQKGDPETVAQVKNWAKVMKLWQQNNESKLPDTPGDLFTEIEQDISGVPTPDWNARVSEAVDSVFQKLMVLDTAAFETLMSKCATEMPEKTEAIRRALSEG